MNTDTTTIGELDFLEVTDKCSKELGNQQFAHHGEFGSITVLDRMTGYGHRDVETGFRDPEGKFWLVSGNFSIRSYPDLTINEAIEQIKLLANTCRGD